MKAFGFIHVHGTMCCVHEHIHRLIDPPHQVFSVEPRTTLEFQNLE